MNEIDDKETRRKALQAKGMKALREWCKSQFGNTAKLATHLGVTQSTFNFWDRVMAERLGDVSNFTGIPRDVLRPDLFEPAEKAAAPRKRATAKEPTSTTA